ncbi:MAG TPA: alpha/beta hydrolase [Sphingomonas sp.]|uniref:alpha/beta hydrolase n=1 Tax=Sphingomonas sp. TaxID=28214 RepID=UPI002CB1EE29|nr:alpha/beta hydrolase [Sphingomonas sp.]HMI17985.1 alpha/beta hydrolase [Sphingomonas sp.]
MLSTLVMLKVAKGAPLETLSGIQNNDPRVYGRFEDPGHNKDVAYLVVHPTNSFMNHYLVEPLAQRGRAILAMNTRYSGSDSMLIMERAIQDLGAGMIFLREQGFKKIVLIGNSGGGSLTAFYQQQAERLTLSDTPDGKPIDLKQEDFPPADRLALLAAHCGRAHTLTDSLDPAVIDETNPDLSDDQYDMYSAQNAPPYDRAWLARYSERQQARNERLTDHALSLIANAPAGDDAFLIYRTKADPRTLDLTIDPSDRTAGSIWGDGGQINRQANGLARFCTARSFLSQWSKRLTRAHGPTCAADTTVPILNMGYSADQSVLPANIAEWTMAAGDRSTEYTVRDAGHYPQSRPDLVKEIADTLVDWGG